MTLNSSLEPASFMLESIFIVRRKFEIKRIVKKKKKQVTISSFLPRRYSIEWNFRLSRSSCKTLNFLSDYYANNN